MVDWRTDGLEAHFVLAADPRMVWIPLLDGQVCGVMAHVWDLEGSEASFFVLVHSEERVERLEIATFPKAMLADELVLRKALSAKYLDWDSPVDNSSTVLVSPPESKVLVGYPDMWDVGIQGDLSCRVLNMGCSLEGPYLSFALLVQGWPVDSPPVVVESVRLPASMVAYDVDQWVTRVW